MYKYACLDENNTSNFSKKFYGQNTVNNQQQQNRGRGRFNKQQKWKMNNKTVHINPHFKGDVQINGNGEEFKSLFCLYEKTKLLARLKWDPPKNQKPNYHNRGYNNFRQPVQVWQHQQQQQPVPDRFMHHPPYLAGNNLIHEDIHQYAPPQMPQMVSSYLQPVKVLFRLQLQFR